MERLSDIFIGKVRGVKAAYRRYEEKQRLDGEKRYAEIRQTEMRILQERPSFPHQEACPKVTGLRYFQELMGGSGGAWEGPRIYFDGYVCLDCRVRD